MPKSLKPSAPRSPSAARLLAEKFPPLHAYWPNLPSVSAQQAAFLTLEAFGVVEGFYGGAAGGGKSDALLAGALQYTDRAGYAALILRRSYTDLALPGAAMARSKEWLHGKAKWRDRDKTWLFPSGATLTFGYLEQEADVYRYQSSEFQFIGFDELTQFSEWQYLYLFSRLRRTVDVDAPLRMRSASNPGGIGHIWVKGRFIEAGTREAGAVFIPARLRDNPGLAADEYVASLEHLPDVLRQQLLDGDWDAFEGAAVELREEHLVERFELLDAFDRFEAADYGLNGAPWALWSVDFEGNLVATDMLYERDVLPSDLAGLVIARRKGGWGVGHSAFVDPSIWHRTGARNKWGAPAMLADEFTDHGVSVTPANNDPRAGLIRLRELLATDPAHRFPDWHERRGELGAPRLFFVRGACSRLVEELRSAPLQPIDKRDGGEIVDPVWESRHGHAVAMARYAVMTRPGPSEKPDEPLEDPRAELVRQRDLELDSPGRRRYTNV